MICTFCARSRFDQASGLCQPEMRDRESRAALLSDGKEHLLRLFQETPLNEAELKVATDGFPLNTAIGERSRASPSRVISDSAPQRRAESLPVMLNRRVHF